MYDETFIEKVCGNCKCYVVSPILKRGQCVYMKSVTDKTPHVHFTEPHFKCSTHRFEPKETK